MENCFVTRLKGIVENNNLEKLGELRIKYSNVKTTGSVTLRMLGGIVYTLDGSNNLSLDNGTTFTNEVIAPMGDITIRLTGELVIGVKDYYNVTYFGINNNNSEDVSVSFDTSHIKYMSNLSTFRCVNTGRLVSADTDDFVGLTALTQLYTDKLKGDIAILGTCTNLDEITIYSSAVEGTLESFVQTMRQSGKTTNNTGIKMGWLSEINITIGGNRISEEQTSGNAKLYWTENTITYDNERTEDAHSSITVNA